jgi:hypothetical protein
MSMPEASMYKDGYLSADEGDVRLARDVLAVQAITGIAKLPA